MVRGIILLALLAALPALGLGAQANFARGEELFMQNNPDAARPALEAALEEDPANIKTYQYLAVVYLQLGRPEDAIAVYLKALPRGGSEVPVLAYNLGNVWFGTGNYDQAVRYYSEAIQADPAHASAWLNRANAKVRLGALQEAVEDYRYYLTLDYRSPKRPQIERLVAFITEEFAAAERQRVAEEARIREEEERRRRLLEEVSASLQADAGETQGLSAGREGLLEYDGEFELE